MNSNQKSETTVGFALPVLNEVAPSVIPSVPVAAKKTESPFNTSYWLSVGESLRNDSSVDPVFGHEGEFPSGSTSLDAVGRRDFTKLLGASMALAGVGMSCQRPPTEVMVPYHKNPDGVTVGNPLHYATAITYAGHATSVLVKAHEGRPIKIEGNPEHPSVAGKAGPLELAHLLQMYDPHRAKLIKQRNGRTMAKKAFVDVVNTKLAVPNEKGAKTRFLVEPSGSPLLASLREEIQAKLPEAKFISYTPISQQARHDAARVAFGMPLDPVYDFSKAKVVLSLDHNFLMAWGPNLANSLAWANAREPGANMSRLYVVEPALTVTGSMADHRLRVRGSQIEGFARAVAKQLGMNVPGELSLSADQAKFVSALVEDLRAKGGEALVVAGERQSAAVHALAYAMNSMLGSIGKTVRFINPVIDDTATGAEGLKGLVAEINAGSVDTLVITAQNPVYGRYADIDLAGALGKVANTFYWGLYEDETAALAGTVINAAHALESWGDAKASDGSILIQQPLIEPLYSGFSEAQFLALWAGRGEVKGLELLKGLHLKKNGMADSDFSKALQMGFVPESLGTSVETLASAERVAAMPVTPAVAGLELQLVRDGKLHDGALGNVPWLQELPDPITKLVWDNALMVSPKTAKEKFNLQMRDLMAAPEESAHVVELTVGTQTVRAPLWIAPGHADDAVTLALGYGRTSKSEKIASGEFLSDLPWRSVMGETRSFLGVDAYSLRTSTAPWFMAATVTMTDKKQQLSCTQEHWDMHDRKIALEANVAQLLDGSVSHGLEELRAPLAKLTTDQAKMQVTLQAPVDYSKVEYKWGMAVDLNRCTGCSACITACQSENNIPVVGREGVKRNREMFWLRLDRYFGSPAGMSEADVKAGKHLEDPTVITQMVTCQQCETAPCEYVCPVNATVHSEEGLNDMIYNRCIGTRYCSNNCPYKVRRYNYFNYTGELTSTQKLAQNPEVTVRARGVMEKCTFCIQRIESARITSRRTNSHLADGAVQTACQQACPTSAIEFGNLNDPGSRVSRAHENDRAYNLLQQLGTRPRNKYLTRIRNPNPKLVAAAPSGDHHEAHE